MTLSALVASGQLGLTAASAQTAPAKDPLQPAAAASLTAERTVERASELLSAGKVIQARALLVELTARDAAQALSDTDRARAFGLLANADRRMKTMTPAEISLQKADMAMSSDDLRTAERHARAVLGSAQPGSDMAFRAQDLLIRTADRRAQLTPAAPAVLQAAVADFDAGRFPECKASLDAIARAGVELSPSDLGVLDDYQQKIIELEQARGKAFAVEPAALSMFQPGVVKRRDDVPAAAPAPTPAPAPAPTGETTARAQPTEPPPAPTEPPAEPAPAPQPTDVQPAPATVPDVQPQPVAPPEQDLIRAARSYEAQSLLAEADQAFDQRRLNEAAERYSRLRDLFRDYLSAEQLQHVESRLSESKVLMRGAAGPGDDILKGVVGQRDLAKQQAIAEFNNLLQQATKALEAGDIERARDLVARSRLTLSSAREVMAESEYENYQKQASDLRAKIDTTQEELVRRDSAARDKKLREDAAKASEARSQEKDRKIREALVRARALQMERKYDEALQVVDQILFLDPVNPAGLLLRDVLYEANIYKKFGAAQKAKGEKIAEVQLQTQEALISPPDLVNYPADWPTISQKRGEPIQFAESPENRRVLSALEKQRIPVDIKDNALTDVFSFLQTVTGLNFDVDWGSLSDLNIQPETTVSLSLKNTVPVTAVLDRILEKVSPDPTQRAGWAVEDGVVTIASDSVLRKKKLTVIYDVKDLLVEVPDYTNVPEFDLQSVLQSGQGGGSSPFQQNQNQQIERRPLDERTRDIIDIVQQLVDFEGWRDNGGDTGFIQQFGGVLLVTNTAKNHREIQGLLNKLRQVRAMQINVETRFLLVSQGFFEQIGFDIDLYFNANNNQVRTARALDPSVQASDFFDFAGPGLKRSVTGAGTDTDGDGTPDVFFTQPVVNPRPTSVIGAGQNSNGLTNSLLSNAIDASSVGALAAAAPALGIAGQFLDDIQVDFLIKATQADRRTVSLTAPRLTFTNGQTSNIYVATQTAFVSDLNPVVSESAVGFDPTLDTISEGVRLLVEGTISADRRYVTMNVDASVSKLDSLNNFPVTAVAGGQLVSSADTQSFLQLPTVTVTSVQTTVTVPDQGTILLGGQRLVNEVEVESGVPVLSKIPILNRFFSNRAEAKEEQTLLILIKPTVLIQNEEEERNFPGLLDSLRTGLGG
ncbi:MAG: hypothetical protein IT436_15220 [Phycisphaerales bacterium]|nr:hypothetical protein [Phycisphaerales bacterium]